MHIEFYQDDQLVRIIKVNEIKVNPGISGALFDINRLKSTYPEDKKDTQVLSNQRQPSELTEVQKMIEEFKKIYE